MWKKELPTEPGGYWLRLSSDPDEYDELADVYFNYRNELYVAVAGEPHARQVSHYRDYWFCRIPNPPPLPTTAPVQTVGEAEAPIHGVVGGGWDG